MRVAVEKLSGVESAEVSLNDGLVHVQLSPDTRFTVAELRKVIRENGFSPQDATVTLAARLEAEAGGLVVTIPGSEETYRVMAADPLLSRLRGTVGEGVVIEGWIADDEDDVTPATMEVRSVVN